MLEGNNVQQKHFVSFVDREIKLRTETAVVVCCRRRRRQCDTHTVCVLPQFSAASFAALTTTRKKAQWQCQCN